MKPLQTAILTLTLILPSLASADPSAVEEAERLLNTMGMAATFDDTIEQMLNMQVQANPAMAPYRGALRTFFRKHMSYEQLKPEMVQLYADTFSASELREISAFYSTPVGKKTLEKMPELMAKGGEIGVARVQANAHELQSVIEAESERLQQLQQ